MNNRDMISKGRARLGRSRGPAISLKGEQVGTAVLSADEVAAIRRRYATGLITQKALAHEFGVSRAQMCRIVHGQRWAHLLTC